MAELGDYAKELWGQASGTVFAAVKGKRWDERSFSWPDERRALARFIADHRDVADVYLCPYVFPKGSGRHAGAALRRRVVHTDVDGEVDLQRAGALGAWVVGSGSPGHAHVYVFVKADLTPEDHRALCRLLGRFVTKAGRSEKCADNDMLRPPGTINHKAGRSAPVEFLHHDDKPRRWSVSALARKLAPKPVRGALGNGSGDRSEVTCGVVREVKKAGLSEEEARLFIGSDDRLSSRNAWQRDVARIWAKSGGLEQATEALSVLDRVRTGEWLARQEFEPVQWVVPRVLPEGVGLLTGAPKVGKSWLALDMALAAASGRPAVGGAEVEQTRPVLLLALEDGERRLKERAEALGGLPQSNLWYLTEADAADVVPLIGEWLNRHRGEHPLVVLDVLAKSMTPSKGNDSAYVKDYAHMSSLKKALVDHPGSCLLAVHHTRKQSSDDWMDSTSGTQGINGAADFTMTLRAKRGDNRATLLSTGRDTPDYELALDRASTGAWELAGGSVDEAKFEAQERRVADKLEADSVKILSTVIKRGPLTPKEVSARLGMEYNKVTTYLGRLAAAERIKRIGRGRYAAMEYEAPV